MNPKFRLRPTGFNNAEGLSSLTWSNIARCYSAIEAAQKGSLNLVTSKPG